MVIEIRGGAREDDLATVHDRDAVGKLAGEVEILLDQHDREAGALLAGRRMARPMSLMIEGWMPSVGSSSTSSFGRVTSARPMASCCCWPPERSPPRRPSIVLQHREELEDVVGDGALARAAAARSRSRRFSCDRQQREDLAALRHVADAARGRAT